MTDNKIIKALEQSSNYDCELCEVKDEDCQYLCEGFMADSILDLINRQKAEIDKLNKFKSYFDDLYGKGLAVANWHLNGETELFDNFYEAAMKETEDEK